MKRLFKRKYMKFICVLFVLCFMSVIGWTQDADSSKRNVVLKVVDRRSRPIRRIIVSSPNNSQAGMTDNSGQFVFSGMTDDDIISVMLSGVGEVTVPVVGMDAIVVIQNSRRRYSYVNNEGQSVILSSNNTQSSNLMDVPAMMKQRQYRSLIDLLQGNVAGLNISADGSATIRGPNSIYGSSEPIVFVNGMEMGTLSLVNSTLSVYDIQSIEVLKEAAEYGMRGANGVILIKTKTASLF